MRPIGERLYVAVLVGSACIAAAAATAGLRLGMPGWSTFAILAGCAAMSQFMAIRAGADAAEAASLPFVLAAALLLPPALVAPIGVAQHSLDWIAGRPGVRGQLVAISRTTIAALLASWTLETVYPPRGVSAVFVSAAAAGVFLGVRRLMNIGAAIAAPRSGRVRDLDFGTELVVASIGIALATLWRVEPLAAAFAVLPLLAVYRSLEAARLREQAHVDPKTGLFNARHIEFALEEELARGRRFGRPASVIMADLDLLREVNNTYGHLAGDAVLQGVADVFRSEIRPYDSAGRFGGEEFAVLLPEADSAAALEIAERIRRGVAARRYAVGGDDSVRVTISLGVASFPADATTADELLHRADLAVYRAKLQGRNRVHAASDDPATTPPPLRLAVVRDPAPMDLPERADRRSLREFRSSFPGRHEAAEWLMPRVVALGLAALLLGAIAGMPRRALAFATATLLPALLVRRSRSTQAEHQVERAEKLWRAAETLHAQTRTIERDNRLLRESSTAAMETLSAVIDARDSHTAGHSRRVQRISLAIGRELRMSDQELDVLSKAALFHDIGKLAVPEAILLKPAHLDSQEWRIVRRHPGEGARLLGRLSFLADALPAIRHHHERYDGSGYPEGLAGEEIPLGARIVNVSDALDAMLTPRVYRPARTPLEALEELRTGAGTQFCPRCVDAIDRIVLADFAAGADPLSAELLAG